MAKVDDEEDFVVSTIRRARRVGPEPHDWEYFISWYGYPKDADTWEPEENLSCREMVDDFFNQFPQYPSRLDFTIGDIFEPDEAWIKRQARETKEFQEQEKRKEEEEKAAKEAAKKAAKKAKADAAKSTPPKTPKRRPPPRPRTPPLASIPIDGDKPLTKKAIKMLQELGFDAPGAANIIPSPGKSRSTRRNRSGKPNPSYAESSEEAEAPPSKRRKTVRSASKSSHQPSPAPPSKPPSIPSDPVAPSPAPPDVELPTEDHEDTTFDNMDVDHDLQEEMASTSDPPVDAPWEDVHEGATQEEVTSSPLFTPPTSPKVNPETVEESIYHGLESPVSVSMHLDEPAPPPDSPTPQRPSNDAMAKASEFLSSIVLPSTATVAPVLAPPANIQERTSAPLSRPPQPLEAGHRGIGLMLASTSRVEQPQPPPRPVAETPVQPTPIPTKARLAAAMPGKMIPLGRGAPRVTPLHSSSVPSSSAPTPSKPAAAASSLLKPNLNAEGMRFLDSLISQTQAPPKDGTSSAGASSSKKPLPISTEGHARLTMARRASETLVQTPTRTPTSDGWASSCKLFLGNKRRVTVQVINSTVAAQDAKIKLEHLFKMQESLRINKLLSIHLFESLVMPSFSSIQYASLRPANEVSSRELAIFVKWLNNTSQVCAVPIKIGSDPPGKFGTIFMFSPKSTALCKQLRVPESMAQDDDNLILMLAGPRRILEPKKRLHIPELHALDIPTDVISNVRGLKYAIVANTKWTYYGSALQTRLRQSGAVAVDVYGKGKPEVIFVHLGTRMEKIPGLAHRRATINNLRFISFGRHGLFPEKDHGFHEIWPVGGVVCVTPRAIYEDPFGALNQLRTIAGGPCFHAYITPAAIAFLSNGLQVGPETIPESAFPARDVLLELIGEGSISVTSCPPSKKGEAMSEWVSLNLRIRAHIVRGLIAKTNNPAVGKGVKANVDEFLELCQSELRNSPVTDEEDINGDMRKDLLYLQQSDVGKKTWRRYVLLVAGGTKVQDLVSIDDGVEESIIWDFSWKPEGRAKKSGR